MKHFYAGTLFGVPVMVDFFVGILVLIIGLTSDNVDASIFNMAIMVSLYICLLGHEFGHVLIARRFGFTCSYVEVKAYGMLAHIDMPNMTASQEFVMAAAGPAVNVVIAGLLMPFVRLSFIETLCYLNILLAAYNLLPVFPMDGGRLLRAVLFGISANRFRATQIAFFIGCGVAAILCPVFFYFNMFFAAIVIVLPLISGYVEYKYVSLNSN